MGSTPTGATNYITMIKYKEYSNKSGIYRFWNKINNKSYVGQAIDINKRISQHINKIKHKSTINPLYNAIIKHGFDNFDLEILELVDNKDKKKLDKLECYYIDYYDCYLNGYNQTKGGDGGITGYKFTEEQRKRVSENSKITMKNLYKPIYAYNIKTKETIYAISITAMSHIFNCNHSIWSKSCMGDVITKNEWISAHTEKELHEKIGRLDLFKNNIDTKFKTKYIKHFSFNGKEYIGSVKDAAKFFNISKTYIYGILSGNRNSNVLKIL